jgi:hypothetical protein
MEKSEPIDDKPQNAEGDIESGIKECKKIFLKHYFY